jgi:hypothetical protein
LLFAVLGEFYRIIDEIKKNLQDSALIQQDRVDRVSFVGRVDRDRGFNLSARELCFEHLYGVLDKLTRLYLIWGDDEQIRVQLG